MDEVEDRRSTDPEPAAGNPLEMGWEEAQRMVGPLLRLRKRFLYHRRSLEQGADKQVVDIECIADLAQFAQSDRVLRTLGLPSGEFMRSLADQLDRTGNQQRPISTARQHLMGCAAHLVETLITPERREGAVMKEVFTVAAAAERVAATLNAAGLCPPTRSGFTGRGIEEWHTKVVYKAQRADLARVVFERQQAALGQQHPNYKQWGEERLKKWLADSVRDMARTGYFGAAKPG